MKKLLMALLALGLILFLSRTRGEEVQSGRYDLWLLCTQEGQTLTQLCVEPEMGDQYVAADNRLYEVIRVQGDQAQASYVQTLTLPDVSWLDADAALPVAALERRIALYCTHSDESYEPTDGYYSTDMRGSIYEVAQQLAQELNDRGVQAYVADALHHPHDAGAYRRSRQTAVQLLADSPDCLLDVHRDGIPDPASYAVSIGGEEASKVRLLVGRGNPNMAVNKEFALLIKAVADRVCPGLIKDIYLGRGIYNQDLWPRSLLLECGTYTLEKERVMRSMRHLAGVIDRALYGGVLGSAGNLSDVGGAAYSRPGGITLGAADYAASSGVDSGLIWVGAVLFIGLIGYGVISAGSLRGGMRKAGRNLSEMTGGLIGKPPEDGEEPQHSGK